MDVKNVNEEYFVVNGESRLVYYETTRVVWLWRLTEFIKKLFGKQEPKVIRFITEYEKEY